MSGETKNEKFKRITSKRSTDIQNSFVTLSRCADTRHFSYSKEEVDQLFEQIDEKLKECKQTFYKTLY
jgi:hypothetical protein